MLLPLLVTLLLSQAWADPSPTPATGDTSMDQVLAELATFYEFTVRAATAAAHQSTTQDLDHIRQTLAALVSRLDSLQEVQSSVSSRLDSVQEVQSSVSSRLDSVQEAQSSVSSRLDSVQEVQVSFSSRFDSMQEAQVSFFSRFDSLQEVQSSVSSRLNSVQEAQSSVSSRLDSVQEAQSSVSSRLDSVQEAQSSFSPRFDSLQEVQSSVSSRLETVQEAQVSFASKLNSMQSSVSSRLDAVQESVAAVSCRPEALLDGLVNIQTTVNRLPWRVLGDACENNADCFRAVPSSECDSDGTCTCTAGFRRISRSECQARLLSEPCTTDSECQAVTTHSVCTDGVCACAAGYWNRTNNECRPGVSAGQACTFDQDCSTHRSNFTCNSGECSERVCPGVVHGSYEYRLAGGNSCAQGRVELRPLGGTWGYVCDDSWEDVDASVVCRTLGFSAGRAHCCSAYGAGGPENFYMDDVSCSGSESHLKNCRHSTRDNCSRGEVAAVTCSGPQQNA